MSTDPNSLPFSMHPTGLTVLPASNGQSARRRPGACEGCRSRKSRCNGGKPMCLTCKDRGIVCVYKKSKNRGRPARHAQSQHQNQFGSNIRQPRVNHVTTSNNRSSNSNALEVVSASQVQYPAWDFESTIVQSPQLERDLQWFELDHLGDFPQLDETQNSFLDPHAAPSDDFPGMGVNEHFSANNVTDVTIAQNSSIETIEETQPSSILHDQTFTSINFSTTSLASRLLDVRECCMGISADAEKALGELLSSDILNLDQSQITNSQNCEPELINDSNLLQVYLEAAMNNTFFYTTFLDSDYLSRLFAEVTTGNGVDKIKISLIYTILAAGCQVHWGQGPQCDISKGKTGAAALFSKALEFSETVSEAASPTAFQALLSMSIFAMQWAPNQASRLLAATVACAQYLKLNQARSFTKFGLDNNQQTYLKRAFWLLYAIEKPHSMRLGYFSMLTDATIDHWPSVTFSDDKDPDMLSVLCGFARLSSQAMQQLYSQEGLSKSSKALENTVSHLHKLVNAWKQEVTRSERPPSSHASSKGGIVQTMIHLQFHELMLVIHGRLITLDSGQISSEAKRESERQFLESACAVLDLSSAIDPMATPLSLALIRLQIVAFCIVATHVPTSQQSQKLLVYMGLAYGSCARTSLILDMPFEKVNAVNSAAQQSIGRFRPA